jgi:glycosyltransferase involved in cell wall biosynthesis
MPKAVIVVPCYNESSRLDRSEFVRLLEDPSISLLFVDDGSTDDTCEVLTEFVAQHPDRMTLLALQPNRGKAEAVRQGMLQGLVGAPDLVAFIDADLATPVDEVTRLTQIALESDADAIIGSRIAHLGNEIERSLGRHFLGRVFATAASIALEAPVYDTQCGAKFFRASPLLQRVLDEAFHSRWAFDVELLGRLLAEDASIVEVPLKRWVDVPGSKIGIRSMLKAGADLVQIRSLLARRRKGR